MKKNILIVAYFFPPFGGVGSFRMTKMVKYFRKFGWNITVVTVDEKYYEQNQIDSDKLKDIPKDVKVIRTDRWRQFTKFKEEGVYWSRELYSCLKEVVQNEKFDYLLYTGGPFIHFSIAPKIKKISNTPYILDFRDPWLLTPYNNSKLRKGIAKILEPHAIKNAELVLNVTDDATNLYKSHYNNIPQENFITVQNGFDKDDFEKINEKKIEVDGIKVIYAGKFGTFRNPVPFFEAILDYNKISDRKVYFIHIGNNEKVIEDFIAKDITNKRYIIQLGFKSYHETLEYIKGSDVGLIIAGGHPYEPTTKIYDYIALNKKILSCNDIEYGYLYNTLKDYGDCIQCKNTKDSILEAISNIKISQQDHLYADKMKFDREYIFRKLEERILT